MTPEQEKEILDMLEDHKRARWAWSGLAIVCKWITTVVGGVSAAYVAWKYAVGEFISGIPK